VPELLAPAGTINFQNVGDNYYAVVPPNTNLSQSEVRRVYLQFVVDPLVSKNAKDILPFRDGIKQLLEERRKAGVEVSPDVFLAVSRSLVSAIDAKESEYQKVQKATAEARQKIDAAQGVEAKRAVSAELAALKQSFADETAAQLSSAYERGAVLSFYFADQLKGLENSGFDISASLRDIILSLDPAKESNRLAQFAAARNRVILARQASRNKNLELPTKLLEIDALINNKNYSEADAQLKKLLDENPNESRIFYTLGRLSSISAETAFDEALRDKRLDDAKANYSNAIRTANDKTDKALIQLSYVALGRIYEFYEQKEMALKIYEAAVKIGEVENGAYKEAMAAKDKLTKKP
jgi:tetratricopeptide (TPR) repeat protein